MSIESLDLVCASYSTVVVAETPPVVFDTQAPFEQWLRSLGAQSQGNSASDVEPKSELPGFQETFQIESAATTNCEVVFAGELHVNGLLTGNIRSAYGTLVMNEHGRVRADVDVRVALIDGHLEGNLRATDHVVLNRNARVAGDIHTPSLTIKDGAVFEGTSFMLERSIYAKICEPSSNPELLLTASASA